MSQRVYFLRLFFSPCHNTFKSMGETIKAKEGIMESGRLKPPGDISRRMGLFVAIVTLKRHFLCQGRF